MTTLGEARRAAAGRLAVAGIEGAALDARLLVGSLIEGGTATVLGHPERQLGAATQSRLAALVERRLQREPLARILGRREFWRHAFRINADTLVPRPETETVVEAALERVPRRDGPLSVLDLGTGSGCLLLSLLGELPGAWGLGIDLDPGAVSVAAANARALGLEERARFAAGDWGRALGGRFELIVANPPYIATGEIAGLMPEVAAYEPRLALDGGPDGLESYRAMAPQMAGLTAPGGTVVLEIGFGQASLVTEILARNRLHVVDIKRDLAGIERCVVAAGEGRRGNS